MQNQLLKGNFEVPIKRFVLCTLILLSLVSTSFAQQSNFSRSFRIKHSVDVRFFISRKYITAKDGGTIIAGKYGSTIDGADLLIMKLDEAGKLVWAKTSIVGRSLYEYELVEMSDGTIVFIGNSHIVNNPDFVMIKFTCQGNIVWSKNMTMINSVGKQFIRPYSIKEGENNDAIVCFYNTESAWQYSVLCRITSAGDMAWSKTFYGVSAGTIAFLSEGKIVVIGLKDMYVNAPNYNKSFFAMKLNYENGTIEQNKQYNYSEFFTNWGVLVSNPKCHFNAEQLSNGNFALFGQFSNHSKTTSYYYKLILQKDLSIIESQAFSAPLELSLNLSKIAVFPNGQTHIMAAVYESGSLYWFSTDEKHNKLREKRMGYPSTIIEQRYMTAQTSANSSSYIISTNVGGKGNVIEMLQVEDGDKSIEPCLGTDTSFIGLLPWQVTLGSAIVWTSIKDNEVVLSSLAFNSADIVVTSEYICAPNFTTGSSGLKIIGQDSVCTGGSNIYKAQRANISQPVSWQLVSPYLESLTPLNDSMVSVKLKKPGIPQTLKLFAFTGACKALIDSIEITLLPDNNILPKSLSSCDLPVTLHPGPWLKTYSWENGLSTDSVYTITKAGKYLLQMLNHCGSTIKDSVEVIAPSIDLVDVLSVCQGDSVIITAPVGFTKYDWSPSNDLLQLSDNSIRIFPKKDALYVLKAVSNDGCELSDTTLVRVHKPAEIYLGKDSVLCYLDNYVLDAGTGFTSYNWNIGSVNQKISINVPGTYSVKVKDINGCLSSDTVIIEKKECFNTIHIPTAFTPNEDGKNDTFKPIVSGRLEKYKFTVFNRWGEIVFVTDQIGVGWSGKSKGLKQATSTYLWTCEYKFLNEKSKFLKGSVTAIL